MSKTFDVAKIKKDFPLLERTVHDRPIIYLDSGASSLQPHVVIDAMSHYYATTHANVHRGVYSTAEEATILFERSRQVVGAFLGAVHPAEEIVFTKNTTESINLLANSWGATNLGPGFEIRWITVDSEGFLILDDLDALLEGAKLLSITAMSNVLGTINPIRELAARAHAAGALIHVDGAQSVPHLGTNVVADDLDFLSFSGHKVLGPTGIGVLWGRRELLAAMPPFLGGGGMILDVKTDGFLAADPPQRFEAGTPPIAEAIGLSEAIRYIDTIGIDEIRSHELHLTTTALDALAGRFGDSLTVHGPGPGAHRGGVISFTLEGVHAHDMAQILDSVGVCVRPGHHCAKPLMRFLGVPATARASFGLYNDEHDIEVLLEGIDQAAKLFT